MKSPTIDRKLDAFKFNAHAGSKPVLDYAALIDFIISLPEKSRVVEIEGRIFAVPFISRKNNIVFIIAYEGERGINPMMFDTQKLSERVEKLDHAEILATKTHVVINLKTRKSVVEYNHRGAKADDIAYALTRLGRSHINGANLHLQFSPIAGDQFQKAIDKLIRIRTARLKFSRPNPGWTDAQNKLTEVAEDSGAHFVDVEFTASRGEALDAAHGVIAILRKLAKQGMGFFKAAEVKGFEADSKKEKTVKLENFTESKTVTVPRDADGLPSGEHVKAEVTHYLMELKDKELEND
jgi:hypothetical protein